MSLETNLHGRLKNTDLPASNGLLPLFEAVANSIHAIEDRDPAGGSNGTIRVRILRDKQQEMDFKKNGHENIVGFEIQDDGIGFDTDNMTSFRTLDSEHKASRGGRGVGRLLWLKAFSQIQVTSTFQDSDESFKQRSFRFTPQEGVTGEALEDSSIKQHTTRIQLSGFEKRYQKASPKKIDVIARKILEHCLWYFIREGGQPEIFVTDREKTVLLDTLFEDHMVSQSLRETIRLKDFEFDLIHVKVATSSSRNHSMSFCAANRLVTQENLQGKIPGLYGSLRDDSGKFTYECYASSPLLDERVRAERTSFDIEEDPLDLLPSELSQKEIREGVLERSKAYLDPYLSEKKKLGQERINNFVATRAPRYRPILNRVPEDQLAIDPEISDKELDLVLHKHLSEIESEMLAEGHDILNPQSHESFHDYKDRVQDYLQTVQDIKQSDLANYVSHRRVIIDLLDMAIQADSEGKYAREDLIHSLIMPMRQDSNEIAPDGSNLWLIDERLAFHNYLASDKPISSMPITDSDSRKEPDIVALNVFDNPMIVADSPNLPLASLNVIELKRPMRDNAGEGEDKDPIEQALGYLDRIRQGRMTTETGRQIPGSENTPGFCYVLCDLTPSIERRCKLHDAIRTSDGLGYFFYHKHFQAYVEVISFSRLVNSAKERNKAFFDKLGLPTN